MNEKSDEKLEQRRSFDYTKLKNYAESELLIQFIRTKFKRLRIQSAKILNTLLLKQDQTIKISDLKVSKTFYRKNMGKFDIDESDNAENPDAELKYEYVVKYRDALIDLIIYKENSVEYYDENIHKDIVINQNSKGTYFVVNENTDYATIRQFVCDEGGDVVFKYDFINSKQKITHPRSCFGLQHCRIQIVSVPIGFDYPVEYVYNCEKCGAISYKKPYQTASTKGKIECQGIYEYVHPESGEPKARLCNKSLYPDDEVSLVIPAFYYDINYENEEGQQVSVGTISFNKYEPGFYECVLFKVNNPKKSEQYHIIDIKTTETNHFDLPDKQEGVNYAMTLVKACDDFIYKQTNVKIHGLLPIKVALMLQSVVSYYGKDLGFNIQVIGDSSTGKSLILKYYGFLLYNNLNIMSAGVNVSIPGLRGTRQSVSLMGTEIKLVTVGLLGSHKAIHIDEAGENRELVQTLKTFLLEDNYSYDKAGSMGVIRRRTAHVNLSENLDHSHVGQYRGMIRKRYREDDSAIGEEPKPIWDEEWDLFLPLFRYDNPYLLKAIKEVRIELAKQQRFWIDGYDIALHERFPFYFYIEKTSISPQLKKTIKENINNPTISESLELINVLKTKELVKFFKLVAKNMFIGDHVKYFDMVDTILHEYKIDADARYTKFCYRLVQVSRALNMREVVSDEDYDLLRWFIENTNCKIDINNMSDYKVLGPPNVKKQIKYEDLILNQTEDKKINVEFGLPLDEF